MSNASACVSIQVSEPRHLRAARASGLLKRMVAFIGEEELMDALALSGDPRADACIAMRHDPAYRRHSFASLCERAGLGARELSLCFRNGRVAQARLLATMYSVEVVRAIAKAALPHREKCIRCDGAGTVGESQARCHSCFGRGTVRTRLDLRAAQLLLEVAGMI
jgi:hypothetical protein